jgi:hypothetical protein
VLAEGALHLPQELLEARVAACKACAQYKGHRCTLQDYGCRKSYLHQLYRESGVCPLGHWKKSKIVPDMS